MRNLLRSLILFPFIIFSTYSNGYCEHTKSSFRCVKYVDNYDADTITFNIHDTHPIIGEKVRVRLDGIDAAEIRTDDACELKIALMGRNEVRDLLEDTSYIHLVNVQRGKYFRIAASVVADGVDVGEYLLKRKLAYKYDGGKKRVIDWCKVLLWYH